jgi:hypothetical protein
MVTWGKAKSEGRRAPCECETTTRVGLVDLTRAATPPAGASCAWITPVTHPFTHRTL